MRKLRVSIVGGGIGGLTAANAMLQRGLDVTVFEQAPALGEIGAGVMIAPNSVRLLERMGMAGELDRVGSKIGERSSYLRMDGTRVGPIVTSDTAGAFGVYGVHRADLLAMLAAGIPAEVIRTGHQCVGYRSTPEGPRLTFANGAEFTADVVVAADGIHSVLRDEVVEPASPVFSGMVAYRGLVPADELPDWPRDAHLVWMGEGKHFMVFPVRSGTLLNFVGFLPSVYPAAESWSGHGDAATLAHEFDRWDPLVQELLSKVTSPFWWGLFDREPLSNWTNGRLALMGDSAHAMLPHLGQGANQAIEDAVALAAILSTADPANLERALAVYEEVRRPRAIRVQLGARANGRRYDSQYDDLAQRDAEIEDAATLRAWLYDYDVEQALALHQGSLT